MATISKTGVVVFALVVGVPEIDQRAAQRTAAPRQNKAGQFEWTAADARLAQLGLKKGPSV
jgi:hypothetical protein